MAVASLESIQQLIENSEQGLAQIEAYSPQILITRQLVEDVINAQGESNNVLDLLSVVLDTILAENEVIYDLSASLDALLKANDDYTKRYYMQSLNLCFWESCQLFVGEDGDEYGLLSRIEVLSKQFNQAGCQFIAKHIIDDINEFRKEYADRELRNITRHYETPIKMYEKQQGLMNIDYFTKGCSQLMAIRMEVTVLSFYLLSLLTPANKELQRAISDKKSGFDLKGLINDALFKAFKKRNFHEEVRRTLEKGQASLDDCYRLYNQCQVAVKLLKDRNSQIPEDFKKMESLILLRMETVFLRNDVACSIWGYLNASSEKERSQNLRLIYITKQAALTHIYGYNEKVRDKSLWAQIKKIEESSSEKFDTAFVEKSLKELTEDLTGDKSISNMFAHYRYRQNYYIPTRLEAFSKMQHHKELFDAMKLLNVCKVLDSYSVGLLCCIHEKQKNETKRKHDEWIEMIEKISAKMGNDERTKDALKPLRDLIDKAFSIKTKEN